MQRVIKIVDNNIESELAFDLGTTGYSNPENLEPFLQVNTSLTDLEISMRTENTVWTHKRQQKLLDFVTRGLYYNRSLKSLRIYNVSFGKRAARRLAYALKKGSSLEHVILAENGLDAEDTNAIFEALHDNTNLKSLQFAENQIGEKIGDLILNNTHLQELIFVNCNISKDISNEIFNAVTVNKHIKQLSLNNNRLDDDVSALYNLIKNNDTLEDLKLIDCHLGPERCRLIAEALLHNQTLMMLSITHNNIGPDGCSSISEVLENSTSLKCLDIRSNNIGTDGLVLISNALMKNTSLDILSFGYNQIELPGIYALAKALEVNTTLSRLFMPDIAMTHISAKYLLESIASSQSLTRFRFDITDDETFPLIAPLIRNSKTLEFLAIGGRRIDEDAFPEIIDALRNNESIEFIQTKIPQQYRDEMTEIFIRNRMNRERKTTSLFELLLDKL